MAGVTGEHYFTAEPARRRAPPRRRVRRGRAGLHAGRGRRRVLRRPARPGHGRAAAQGRPARRRRPPGRSSTSAAGTARSRACWPPRRRGATVYAVDVNARARELTARQRRAARRGRPVRVAAPDEVPDDVRFAEIWSQPADPGRQGGAARAARALAAPAGARTASAWLVVARHLGGDSLHAWLVEQGWQVDRHASQKGFRVLRVTRKVDVTGDRVDRAGCRRGLRGRRRGRAHAAGRPGALRRRVVPGRRGRQGRAGRPERRRQDHAAADGRRRPAGHDRRGRAVRRAGRDAAVHRHGRRRVDARATWRCSLAAAGAAGGRASGSPRPRPRCTRPRPRHQHRSEQAQLRVRRRAGRLGRGRRVRRRGALRHRRDARARPAVGRAHATGRSARSPAASRSASRWSCCCAAPTRCCCSTSRTTSSTCPASAGWRSGCASRTSRCSTSRTTGSCWPRPPTGWSPSRAAAPGRTRAASPPGTRPGSPGTSGSRSCAGAGTRSTRSCAS